MAQRTNFRMEDAKFITMFKGDTLSFSLEVEDQDGQPLDVDGAFMTCRKNITDEIPLFQKTLGTGIDRVQAGVYSVRVRPDETMDAVAGKYFYDFRVEKNGDVFTLMSGILELLQDVTENI